MKTSKVKSVKRVPTEDIYHLTVRKNHNFVGNGIVLHNCGYHGEVMANLFNASDVPFVFNKYDRIAQMAICRLPVTNLLIVSEFNVITERGDNGHGSTGLK